MKLRNNLIALQLIIVLILAGCNINVRAPSDQNVSAAATIVAQTLTAAAGPSVLNSPAPQVSETPNFTTLAIADNTNCREGPGKEFAIVSVIAGGVSVQILARSDDGKYWIVAAPNNAGACWISSEFGVPSGNTGVLPVVTPAVNVSGSLEAPAFLKNNGWTFFCYGTGQTDVTLNWADKSDNESGYRILRNGDVVAELPANSNTYSETITLLSGQSVGYQIQGFNPSGTANSSVATMTCP